MLMMLIYILTSLLVLVHGRYVKEVEPRNNLIQVTGGDLSKTNLEIVKKSINGDDLSLLDRAIKTSTGSKGHNKWKGLFSMRLHKSKNFHFNNDYWDWPLNISVEENRDVSNSYHQKRELNTNNLNETDQIYEESKEAIGQSKNKQTVNSSWRHSPIKDLYKIIQNHTLCGKEENLGLKGWFCLYKNIKHKTGNTNTLKHSIKLTGVWTAGFYLLVVIPMWIIRGWFVWCCPCKICSVDKMLADLKDYIVTNPPGIYNNNDGSNIHYAPLPNEITYYDKLCFSIKTI